MSVDPIRDGRELCDSARIGPLVGIERYGLGGGMPSIFQSTNEPGVQE